MAAYKDCVSPTVAYVESLIICYLLNSILRSYLFVYSLFYRQKTRISRNQIAPKYKFKTLQAATTIVKLAFSPSAPCTKGVASASRSAAFRRCHKKSRALPGSLVIYNCVVNNSRRAQLDLYMNVRRTAAVGHGSDGAKAVTAVSPNSDPAKTLKPVVSPAPVARMVANILILPRPVALPNFNDRPTNRPPRQVANSALKPDSLAHGVSQVAIAQQIKVAVFRKVHRVKRPFSLRRRSPPRGRWLRTSPQPQRRQTDQSRG